MPGKRLVRRARARVCVYVRRMPLVGVYNIITGERDPVECFRFLHRDPHAQRPSAEVAGFYRGAVGTFSRTTKKKKPHRGRSRLIIITYTCVNNNILENAK